MNRRIALLLAGAWAAPALAQDFTLKPIIDARLRYEGVEQAGFARDADALTVRVRAGAEAKVGDFALLAESEAALAIGENYNSGLNGRTAFPIVPDPETIELNRLQLQYLGLPKAIVTVGRQRINLDDQRFVGSVAWRNNEQTFDAARVVWSGVKALKVDITYAWSDRTIWGIDGGNRYGPARYRSIGGDNIFANLALTTKVGQLTGFAYLVDQDEPLVLRNSSATYGVRFAGARALGTATRLNYIASYARQTDHASNPVNYAANYYFGELTLDWAALHVGGGYEVLGSGGTLAFQTPLATLHKFNGWADKFLVTPANGLRDAYAVAGYGWKKAGPFDAIALLGSYHRFDSDRNSQHYGDEIDLQASARRGRTTVLVKYADYRADRFAVDTRKLWLSVEWAI